MFRQDSLQVTSDLNALNQILAWCDDLEYPLKLNKDWHYCQLALAEGFTNAVRHAHKDLPPETPISIELLLKPDYWEIQIWDQGPPFNLATSLEALPAQIDPNNEGGRGLKLMQHIADQLTYQRTADGRNCLLIRKRIQPEPAADSPGL